MRILDFIRSRESVLKLDKAELESQIKLLDLEKEVLLKKQERDKKREEVDRLRLGPPPSDQKARRPNRGS